MRGCVIEVGAGTGLNFTHYPSTVTEVVAIEPEPRLREVARSAAAGAPVPVTVLDGTADQLPADEASFDAGVASLVLCSVSSTEHALAELFRVIRPGGQLRFYEHVLAQDERWAARQRRIAPVWRRFGGGCHPDRDTASAITAAGFDIESCDEFLFAPTWVARFVASHILGRARRP